MRRYNYNIDEIDYGISKLMWKTRLLKLYSMLMLLGTATNIIYTVYIIVMYDSYYYSPSRTMVFTVSISLMVLILAFLFDMLKRDGNTLFETISDELHSSISSNNNIDKLEDISFKARLSLRSFTQHSDIPLLPGKFGPALICLTNILLLIFSMTFLRKLMK